MQATPCKNCGYVWELVEGAVVHRCKNCQTSKDIKSLYHGIADEEDVKVEKAEWWERFLHYKPLETRGSQRFLTTTPQEITRIILEARRRTIEEVIVLVNQVEEEWFDSKGITAKMPFRFLISRLSNLK